MPNWLLKQGFFLALKVWKAFCFLCENVIEKLLD